MPSLLTILLSDQAARALCWTLVHSLWQGTLAALIAGAIIGATRKRSAALRYNLLSILIAAFLLGVAITIAIQLNPSQQKPAIDTPALTTITIHHPGFQNTPTTPTTDSTPILQTANNYLNTHATAITLIWLAGLGAQLLRLTGGLYNIHRLRRDSDPATKYWTDQLTLLAQQVGIKRPVALLQSAAVKAPAAFGFLKPAILVPLGFLAQLPAHQVETILLHELAHIRRSDYLTNIILHLTEAIFFFNPGIRWIAALIRREREACCDDIVLARTPDGHNYFEALVAFTQLTLDQQNNSQHAYMLQFSGRHRADLFWRIKRMLEKENKKLHLLEKTVLSVALFALVSFSLIKPQRSVTERTVKPAAAATKTAQSKAAAANTPTLTTAAMDAAISAPSIAAPVPPVPTFTPDTTPQKKFEWVQLGDNTSFDSHTRIYKAKGRANDGHTYEIHKRDEEIFYFKVDGKTIPQEKYPQYLAALAAFEAHEHNEIKEAVQPGDTAISLNSSNNSATITQLQQKIDSLRRNQSSSNTANQSAEANPPADPDATYQPDNSPNTEHAPTRSYPLVFSKSPNIDILHIAVDLVHAGAITDVNRYEFTLTNDFLEVNGKTQPDNIFKSIRAKYVHGPEDTFKYSQYWTKGGSGSHCEVHTPSHSEDITNTY